MPPLQQPSNQHLCFSELSLSSSTLSALVHDAQMRPDSKKRAGNGHLVQAV